MRSSAICLAFSIAFFLASCEKPANDPKLPPVTPPSGTEPAKTPPAAPGSTDTTLGDLKKATSSAGETAKEVAATARDQLGDAAAALGSAVTPEKLKEMVAAATPEKLKEIADKIVAALQDKEGVLKDLKDRLATIGTDPAKAPEIKKEVESTTSLIAQLKDKLKVVVEQLKAKGIDVSKYTAFLG